MTFVLRRVEVDPSRHRRRAYKVFIDKRVVGRLKRGQSATFELPPGSHTVQVAIDWVRSRSFHPSGDRDHTLRCGPGGHPWKVLTGHDHLDSCIFLEPDTGDPEPLRGSERNKVGGDPDSSADAGRAEIVSRRIEQAIKDEVKRVPHWFPWLSYTRFVVARVEGEEVNDEEGESRWLGCVDHYGRRTAQSMRAQMDAAMARAHTHLDRSFAWQRFVPPIETCRTCNVRPA